MRGCRPRAGRRRTRSRDVVVAARLRQINATLLISLPVPPVVVVARAPGVWTQRPQPERIAAGGGGDARRKRVYGWRGGAASFRGADTAKVCNNVGLVLSDGAFECSAVAATQGVSGILRARQGLRHLSLTATSAFDATSTRHVSARP
jgi:hypothetical protein